MQDDDELRIEDIADDDVQRHFVARLIRRAWGTWHLSPRSARESRAERIALAGMTALLVLVLVGMAGDAHSLSAGQVSVGGDPVLVQPEAGAPAITVAGFAPRHAATAGWEQIALPPPSGAYLTFTASPLDPATLFACTGLGYESPLGGTIGDTTRAWRTRDTGAHWSALALPSLLAPWCLIKVAPDVPSRVTVLSGSQLFLSDDGGDSWSRIALPPFPQQNQPGVTFLGYEVMPTAHHLYAQIDYFYDPPIQGTPSPQRFMQRRELSVLARSDDEGRTWMFEGQTLGTVIFRPFLMGDENTLITSTVFQDPSSHGSHVWLSRDAGASWAPLNSLDEAWTVNLVTVPVASAGAHPPVYAMIDEQIPSSFFRLKVQQLNSDDTAWHSLPPLPVSGASPTRMGLVDIVGETPGGRLLALGVDPAKGVPAEASAIGGSPDAIHATLMAPWLWTWDPRATRWRAVAPVPPVARDTPASAPTGCSAVCWLFGTTHVSAGEGSPAGTYLSLHAWFTAAAPVADRIFLPDSSS